MTTIAMTSAPATAIERLTALATAAGWRYDPAYDRDAGMPNHRALAHGDYRYPTLRTPDGLVAIALSTLDLYYHNDNVWSAEGEPYGTAQVALVVTDPAARRRGLATAALCQVVAWAAAEGVTLCLEPVRVSAFVGKGHKGPADHQLAKWYKSLGFRQLRAGRDRILTT